MAKKPLPTRTINPLPFSDLEPHRFEDLVRNLIYDFKRWKSIEATGKAGSDDGFDVRAWEETREAPRLDEDENEPGVHPMEGNLWKIQCKRERQIGPSKIKTIITEGVDNNLPPYGYILAAPVIFSKASYDVFRDELRNKGVMEFYLWGKSELEDMLLLPKNDNVLFAFFGISLVTRRRTRATEVKFTINNKNKLLRVLSEGKPERSFYSPILARDVKDIHYPWKTNYADFDSLPRWKEYTARAFHPSGLLVDVARHFAYVDVDKKQWDSVNTVNLFKKQAEDDTERQQNYKTEAEINNYWKYLPRATKAHLIVEGVICFENMLAIDEKGDPLFPFPHVFVDFTTKSGPFSFFYEYLELKNEKIPLTEDYKRICFFPEVLPQPRPGKIFRDHSVEFDENALRNLRSEYFVNDILDLRDKYSFLNQGDILKASGVKPLIDGDEVFIEITYKYQINAEDYVRKHPEKRTYLENQIGSRLTEFEKLNILEFESVPSWQLEQFK